MMVNLMRGLIASAEPGLEAEEGKGFKRSFWEQVPFDGHFELIFFQACRVDLLYVNKVIILSVH